MVEMLNTMINSHLTIKIVENVTKNSAKYTVSLQRAVTWVTSVV